MVIEEIRNIKSGKSQLRQFGIMLGVVFGLFALLFFIRQKEYYPYFIVVSFVFLFLGLAIPLFLIPVQKIWMSLAILIGWIVTRIILTLLFYLIVTPIGILARLFGKYFLDTRFDSNTNSYWIAREPAKFEKRNYETQY